MQPRPAGTGLFLLVMLTASLLPWGRESLHKEVLPAFFVAPPVRNLLLLDGDFPNPGLHQYSDGEAFSAVIKVANADGAEIHLDNVEPSQHPVSGQTLVARREEEKNIAVTVRWMAARQRLALGMALHPDRMTLSDWPALPGIGPKLALAIEKDRQENGDFGSLEGLERVRGIGPKRIEAWRQYFR
jgi:competence protein ComEA